MLAQNSERSRRCRDFRATAVVAGMITILSALVSLLSFRVRSRASLELKLVCQRRSKNRPAGRSKTRPVCGVGVEQDVPRPPQRRWPGFGAGADAVFRKR